jgi:type I restriction enzyme, S subunit
MTNWKTHKLSDLVTFQRGHDLTVSSIVPGEYPVAGSNGVIGYHNAFTTKGPGLTLGRSGNSIGVAHYYEKDFWAHNTTLYAKTFHNSDPKFMYYLLKSVDLSGHNSGSAVPSLNRNFINPFEVLAPDLPTQRRIAEILSALDDKIELNRRMNQTMEQMAQTLYRQYFVDGIDEENSEPISLLDFVKLIGGGTPKTSVNEYWDGSILWVSAKDVTPNDGTFIVETEKKITELGLSKSSAKLIPQFSTIITARGTVGKLCIASSEMTISQSNYALKAKNGNTDFVAFQLIQSSIDELQRNSYGTVFDTITTNTLRDIKITIPSQDKVLALEEKLRHLYLKILANLKENITLSKTRDSLLPKLMSGEIDVMQTQAHELHEPILS